MKTIFLRIVALFLFAGLSAGVHPVSAAESSRCPALDPTFQEQALAEPVAFQLEKPAEVVLDALTELIEYYAQRPKTAMEIRQLVEEVLNLFLKHDQLGRLERLFWPEEFHLTFEKKVAELNFPFLTDEIQKLVYEILWQVLFVDPWEEFQDVIGLVQRIDQAMELRSGRKEPLNVNHVLLNIGDVFAPRLREFIEKHHFYLTGAAIFPLQLNSPSISNIIVREARHSQLGAAGDIYFRMIANMIRSKIDKNGHLIRHSFPTREENYGVGTGVLSAVMTLQIHNAQALVKGTMVGMPIYAKRPVLSAA